jgi:hypothetical protein
MTLGLSADNIPDLWKSFEPQAAGIYLLNVHLFRHFLEGQRAVNALCSLHQGSDVMIPGQNI